MKCVLSGDANFGAFYTEEEAPTIYVSFLPAYADKLKARSKGIMFFRENYVIGLLGNPQDFNFEDFKNFVAGG